jgi:phage gp46-like protein
LLDDGVASQVRVTAELVGSGAPAGTLGLAVEVTRGAEPAARFQFKAFWMGA